MIFVYRYKVKKISKKNVYYAFFALIHTLYGVVSSTQFRRKVVYSHLEFVYAYERVRNVIICSVNVPTKHKAT